MTSEASILSALEAQCARREYCTSDIRRKALERCEGDAEMAARIVDSLKENRFVDDSRYAAAFARDKASLTGWGPVKIRFALRAKGLSDEDIRAGLGEVDEKAAASRLEALVRNKWKSLEGEPDARLKLIRFALTRGYEYADVERMVKNL